MQRFATSSFRIGIAVVLAALAPAFPGLASACGTVVGTYAFGQRNNPPNDVAVVGDRAYTADGYGLTVYDISNPDAPAVLGDLLLPADGLDIAVTGSTALVAAGSAGLYLIDVSNPASPQVEGHLDRFARAVAVSGSTAWIQPDDCAILPVDISTPSNPQSASDAVPVPDGCPVGTSLGLAVEGSTLFVARPDASSLLSFDISADPMAPSFLDSLSLDGEAGDLSIWNGEAVIALGPGGYAVVDVTDPSNLQYRFGASGSLWDETDGVSVSAGVAALAGGSHGVLFADVDDSDGTTGFLGQVATAAPVTAVVWDGSLAVGTGSTEGLVTVDGTTPTAPVQRARLDSSGKTQAVVVDDGTAYVHDGNGLEIIDVSDPTAPSSLGRLALAEPLEVGYGGSLRMAVTAAHPLLPFGQSGLVVVDASVPATPVEVAHLLDGTMVRAVAVAGTHAYAVGHGFHVIDISNPDTPQVITSLDDASRDLYDIAVMGDHAYVAAGYYGVEIYRIDNPSNPVHVTDVVVGDHTWVWEIGAGDGMVVAQGHVFDASDPEALQERSTLSIGGYQISGSCTVEAGSVVSGAGRAKGFFFVGGLEHPFQAMDGSPARRALGLALDPARSVVWLHEGPELEAVDVGCPDCNRVAVDASPARIVTGGATSTVTAQVGDLVGNPLAGASVTGWTDLGTLSAFADNGDGTYTATLTSGSAVGTARVSVTVDGPLVSCGCDTLVEIVCATEVEAPAAPTATANGESEVQLGWAAVSNSGGYQVLRDGWKVADVDASTLSWTDSGLSPGTRYCYQVRALDPCGGLGPLSPSSCATTMGAARSCPAVVGTIAYDDPHDVADLLRVGDLTYGADAHGVVVWQSTGGSELAHVNTIDLGGQVWQLALSADGGTLYAAGESGLAVLDLGTNTLDPPVVETIGGAAPATGAAVSGDLLVVGRADGHLVSYDLDDPRYPVQTADWAAFGDGEAPCRLHLDAQDLTGLKVQAEGLDTTLLFGTPFRASLGSSPAVTGTAVYFGTAIAASPAYLYAAEYGSSGQASIHVYDLSQAGLHEVGSVQHPRRWIGDMKVEGTMLLTTGAAEQLDVFDLSDPTAPTLESQVGGSSGTHLVPATGGALVWTWNRGPLSRLTLGGTVLGRADSLVPDLVARVGDVAGVIERGGPPVLDLWDVSDPAAPSKLARFVVPPALGMTTLEGIQGDPRGYFWLVGDAGVETVNVSAPSSPTHAWYYGRSAAGAGFPRLEGNIFAVPNGAAGTDLYDASNPAQIGFFGTVPADTEADFAAVSGSALFVNDGWNAYETWDIGDPAAPVSASQLPGFSNTAGLAVGGDLLVAGDAGTARLYDITDPLAPHQIGSLADTFWGNGACVDGTELFLANPDTGELAAWNLSNPSTPGLSWELPPGVPSDQLACSSDGVIAVGTPGSIMLVDTACEPPAAEFEAAVTAPLTIRFMDRSRYTSGASWSWQFGDGGTSTEENPLHVYAAGGSYDVTLAVTTPQGWAQVAHTVTVPAPGDVNADGGVDGLDVSDEVLEIFDEDGFLATHTPESTHPGTPAYDLDGDRSITALDLARLLELEP